MNNLFPPSIRYSGIATGFSLGMAITGGSTAFILTTLIDLTSFRMIPPLYISILTLVWLGLLKFVDRKRSESKPDQMEDFNRLTISSSNPNEEMSSIRIG